MVAESCKHAVKERAAAPDGAGVTQRSEGSRNGSEAAQQTGSILQQLLHRVIFHASNVEGLIELSSTFDQDASSSNQKGADDSPRSYHFQLLQVGSSNAVITFRHVALFSRVHACEEQ